MNIQEMKRVYTRGYETSFGLNPLGDRGGWMPAGVQAVAEWARKEALREAAAEVELFPDAVAAIHALAEGASHDS